ncbi:hypothetical protein HED48_23285 [Ochrobactrum intermedium]|nr:hypothetical protein [Brucella intermedia]
MLTTDADIVGLGAIGTSLVIATKANPYLATGSSPDTMQMVKLEANLPCVNARGIVDLGFAIAYPSNEGLAAVAANGEAKLVTATTLWASMNGGPCRQKRSSAGSYPDAISPFTILRTWTAPSSQARFSSTLAARHI